MHLETAIANFMASERFAVVGASTHRHKYGNKVLRCFLQNGHEAVPVNPNARVVEGVDAVQQLSKLNPVPASVSMITQPEITGQIVDQAVALGVKNIWMQPGAESLQAIEIAEQAGINVIHSGPCILVVLGYRES